MLPPEKTRDGPLCMSQHINLLSCCRIPSSGVDTQKRSPIDQSCHIIVAHNGHVRVITIYTVLEIMCYNACPTNCTHYWYNLHITLIFYPTSDQKDMYLFIYFKHCVYMHAHQFNAMVVSHSCSRWMCCVNCLMVAMVLCLLNT